MVGGQRDRVTKGNLFLENKMFQQWDLKAAFSHSSAVSHGLYEAKD